MFDEKLKQRVLNTYKFSNHDNNKFILLLQKGVYPYKYMGDWEKFNKISLLEKEDFYSHLNIEDITDADYARVYHELHVQGDTLLLADVFENFRNMCLKIYKLDPESYWISMVNSFKKD